MALQEPYTAAVQDTISGRYEETIYELELILTDKIGAVGTNVVGQGSARYGAQIPRAGFALARCRPDDARGLEVFR